MAKYLVPALALAGTVFAQSRTVCDGPSFTITSQADAAQLANCGIYNGDLTIDSTASGTISLDYIQSISGDFTCKNATQLTAIGAPQLATIGKTFDLESLITLSSLNMPNLNNVQKINWIALPALQSLNTNIKKANEVYISNTQLNTLDGIELTMVGSIDVNNNYYLNEINVNDLTNITRALSFSANGATLNVNFPNLANAGNLTFRNVSSVSVPSLSTVGGSIGLYSDYFLNFSAPNLSTIGQALAIVDCAQLQTFSFPLLTIINGGFIVVNNTNLNAIAGVPRLRTVAGAVDFIGTFDSVDFPNLTDVRGGATVTTSSQNKTICDKFQSAKGRVIKGNVKCQVNTQTAQTNGSTSGGSGGNQNAAVTLSVSPVIPFTAILGFLAYMVL